MIETRFCEIQDVNDILGRKSINPTTWYIASGSSFDPDRVNRLIENKTKLINSAHKMNFNETLITDEYHDVVGIPRIMTDYYPITEVVSLYLYNGAEYVLKTEGYDRNNDDFYIQKASNGSIKFWETPTSGELYAKLSYKYGYTTIPGYVKDCCAYMVAVDLALDRNFQEECKDHMKKWDNIIEDWLKIIEQLMNEHIRKKKLGVRAITKYKSESSISDFEYESG